MSIEFLNENKKLNFNKHKLNFLKEKEEKVIHSIKSKSLEGIGTD